MTSLAADINALPADGADHDVALTGVGTTWTAGTPGTPTFTLANTGSAAAISSQVVASATEATVTINTGALRGSVVLTDPSTGNTVTIVIGSAFRGRPITVLADGVPRKYASDVTTEHIPGGGVTYVDLGGQGLITLSLSLLFRPASDTRDFEDLDGTAGRLCCFDGNYATAVLQVQGRSSRGVNGADEVLACDFLLCSEADD